MAHRPSFLSFFSGCGGLDLGFIRAGFTCKGAIDWDADALAVNTRNTASPGLELDLSTDRPPDDLMREVDAYVLGPPCQGFSSMAGRSEGDPRNDLLITSAKLAATYSPSLVVIENVRGARSSLHSHLWNETQTILRAAGYRTTTLDVRMSDLGVPQTRRRVLLVAWTSSAIDRIPDLPTSPTCTLSEVLTNLDGVDGHNPKPLDPLSRVGQIARHIRPGQKLCNVRTSERSVRTWDIPEVFGKTTKSQRVLLETISVLRRQQRVRDWGDADPVEPAALIARFGPRAAKDIDKLLRVGYLRMVGDRVDLTHTFNGKSRRPDLAGLAPTVDSRFGDAHYVLHPMEDRAFTVREAARVQTFPDHFSFAGSSRSVFTMIGNAVPPLAAEHVANSVRVAIDD